MNGDLVKRTDAIELRHLRCVVAAAESGSFRRAAKKLQLSESAISRCIRVLEDEIGVALFIRCPTGVLLTDAGHSFVASARRALWQVRQAAQDAGSFGRGEAGIIRIGVFSSLASGFIRDLLDQYHRANPTVRTEVSEAGPSAHIAALQRQELDIAFLTGSPNADDCDSQHLWNERVMIALPKGDRLERKREIDWNDLADCRFIVSEADPGPEIYDYIVKHLADLGRHPYVERHNVGRDNLMSLVAVGQGVTLVSEAVRGARFQGVVYRPISNNVLPFSALWSVRNDNPALRRFLSLARTLSISVLSCVLVVAGMPV